MHKIVDNTNYDSMASRARRKRLALFLTMVDQFMPTVFFIENRPFVDERPVKVLDVGGTENFWRQMGGVPEACHITLLNFTAEPVTLPGLSSVAGDATRMPEFADGQFDIVFSNSTIEHVGDYMAQRCFANEVQRVGKGYVIQTPNKWFPIEPHFYTFPYWQFYPLSLRLALLTRVNVGWNKKTTRDLAYDKITEIRLLGEKEFAGLFPGCQLHRERVMGLVKSYVVVKGV